MQDLFGNNIGHVISFDRYSNQKDYITKHDWPDNTKVSAGKGVVFVRNSENYTTLFMEVYPPEATFIRGEGKTYKECDDSCWNQYQKALHCTHANGHTWIPKNYKNGAGFCQHCNTFKSQCFTGEDLKQYCHKCNIGTTYGFAKQHGSDDYTFWCENHEPERYEDIMINI